MMYQLNDLGIQRIKFVNKEVLKMIIIGPVCSCVLVFLLYLTLSTSIVSFYVTAIFLIFFATLFFIYAPLLMLSRQNKTVNEVKFEQDKIEILTSPALWLKQKVYVIVLSDLKISSGKFRWYGKEEKSGVTIHVQNENLYLVKDYFNDYDKILELLEHRKEQL